jgi:uncharacterized protein
MTRAHVAFIATVGVATLCGPTALCAQETPAAVRDPISPADCLKDKKKAPDCQRLGLLYAKGEDVRQDEPRAIEFLDAACRAGLASSCGAQGWLLLKRHERPEDVKQGEQLLQRVCKQGALGACGALGQAYASGSGVTRDVSKAATLLEKACDADAQSCMVLAGLLTVGDGVPADAERAKALARKACALEPLQVCEPACDAGNGDACVALGESLARRKDADAGRLQRAYERACNAAAAAGCHDLASLTKDPEQALPLFERACSLDYVLGCVAAGQYYQLGRGAEVDLAKAVRLYTKACDKGASAACRLLGGIHARGDLGSAETAKGQEYFVKACGADVECRAIVANGRIPSAWGGSLEALRPTEASLSQRGPIRVGGSIQPPRMLRNVNPVYPAVARAARIQGTVTLECAISSRGRVTDIRVQSGPKELIQAAVDAVRQWIYTPTLLEGEPVPVIMTVTVSFRIS